MKQAVKVIGVAAYSWVAGHFTMATVEYIEENKKMYAKYSLPSKLAAVWLVGFLWPVVLLICGIDIAAKRITKWRKPAHQDHVHANVKDIRSRL